MTLKRYKIQVYVPKSHLEQVRLSAGDAGAGRLGLYSYCSFALSGHGYFMGSEDSNPALGMKGRQERIEEMRLEFICEENQVKPVLQAVREAHPYEEIPIDIFELIDPEIFT